ncbi:MAG: AhpC/TSA family protein [Candidatus Obscuribacterales bacterium]|nr:AhpC/TSA family protein [Candidatus Obscuribacterales bacterium]
MKSTSHITKDISISIPGSLEFVLKSAQDQYHTSLLELSQNSPVLLVFLRHFGCCFCREALADIHNILPKLDDSGVKVVLVHMAQDEEASTLLAEYGLADLSRISSADQGLYRSFGLDRANFDQILDPEFWTRGIDALFHGHPIGPLLGDGFQMPGIFLLHKGKILKSFRHKQAGERPNYLSLASCPTATV